MMKMISYHSVTISIVTHSCNPGVNVNKDRQEHKERLGL